MASARGEGARAPRRHDPDRVTPTWVKPIDVETTLSSPVEELIRPRAEREGA
jgi:hypothetical protein